MTARLVLGDGEEVIYLDALTRLHLQPGDVLVVSCKERLSDEAHFRLRETFRTLFPDTRVLGLEGGMELAVIRP